MTVNNRKSDSDKRGFIYFIFWDSLYRFLQWNVCVTFWFYVQSLYLSSGFNMDTGIRSIGCCKHFYINCTIADSNQDCQGMKDCKKLHFFNADF